jgi:Tat protein secretion system quality control protein TatD with DNase activity
VHTAECLAKVFGVDPKVMDEHTTQNACTLFLLA